MIKFLHTKIAKSQKTIFIYHKKTFCKLGLLLTTFETDKFTSLLSKKLHLFNHKRSVLRTFKAIKIGIQTSNIHNGTFQLKFDFINQIQYLY